MDDDGALDVARAAVTRLGRAIESEDVAELKPWASAATTNDGWCSEAVVCSWDDPMVWRTLEPSTKESIRSCLTEQRDSDATCGCDGLLLLADLADS